MWNNLSDKYFLNSDYNSLKEKDIKFLFFSRSTNKLYKKYNFTKKYKLANYSNSFDKSSLYNNNLSFILLKQYNLFKLVNFSFSRFSLTSLLSFLSLFNLYFTNYSSLVKIYNYFNKGISFVIKNFFYRTLLLYSYSFLNNNNNNSLLNNDFFIKSNKSIYDSFFKSNFILSSLSNFYVIYVKVSSNNVFITLTKNGSDVLLSLSGGQTSSKKKKTTLTVFFLLSRVINYLVKNNIKSINFLIIKASWYKLANTLLVPLKKKGIVVNYIGFDFLRSHNGLRKRKLRRL